MTDRLSAARKPRRPGLRTRVIASFLGFALGPLVLAVAGVVFLARARGEPLAAFRPSAADMGLLLLSIAVLASLLAWRLGTRFLAPILAIRRGAEIISRINLGHRLEVSTGDEFEELATEFNRMAESLEAAYTKLGLEVERTTADLQEERNRLAAILRNMTEGVVVTNAAAEVLLVNPRARMVLGSGPASGVGAPLTRLLPPARTEFHLKRVRANPEAVEDALFPLAEGKLLRGSLAAISGPSAEAGGFLLVFRDVSTDAEEERARETLRELPALIKGPVTNLHSLAEALELRPDMPASKRTSFVEGIREEARRLAERLQAAEETAAAATSRGWLLRRADARELLEEAAASAHGVFARIEAPTEPLPPVLVEPFSWVCALATVLRWVGETSTGWDPVEARVTVEEESVVTTFRLAGDSSADRLDQLAIERPGEESLPLGEIVRRNRGELWSRTSAGGLEVRLALPATSRGPGRSLRGGLGEQQPEFYDFDLFIPKRTAEAGDRLTTPLAELEYVVFDTETTGLNPSTGDEVVSLSAFRIRGAKLQGAGGFHSLVHPGRAIPPAAAAFHGIVDDMVRDAPPLPQVLPKFREYVGDAVLVGHNAAFDKKFLDLAAARLRVPTLENPILDTLFLSYGLHGEFEGHQLEAIAHRLGVEVAGRHTSEGDARTTAEIFLRLLKLLEARGVHTLADAQSFCDRMLLLRWQLSRF